MARGWESKSVEDQITERQSQPSHSNKNKLSAKEMERNSKREGILLARKRTLAALQSTQDERYRSLLQRTLDHLDSEFKKL